MTSPGAAATSSDAKASDIDENASFAVRDRVWTTINSNEPSSGLISPRSGKSPKTGQEDSDADTNATERDSILHGLMTGAIQLDMNRPVVVQVIKKTSTSSKSNAPSSHADKGIEDNEETSQSDLQGAQRDTNANQTKNQSQASTTTNATLNSDDRNPMGYDVTVIDYLTELDSIGKPGMKDDRCRYFAMSSAPSSKFYAIHSNTQTSVSDSSSQLDAKEISIINAWLERAHVAILTSPEISQLNDQITKSNQQKQQKALLNLTNAEGGAGNSSSTETTNTNSAVNDDLVPLIPIEAARPIDSIGERKNGLDLPRGVMKLELTEAPQLRDFAIPHPNLSLPIKIVEGPEHLFALHHYHRYSLETVFRFSPGVLDSEAKKTFIAYQLLRTLQWLHQAGLVHGDLRPHNVKLTERLWMILNGGSFSPFGLDQSRQFNKIASKDKKSMPFSSADATQNPASTHPGAMQSSFGNASISGNNSSISGNNASILGSEQSNRNLRHQLHFRAPSGVSESSNNNSSSGNGSAVSSSSQSTVPLRFSMVDTLHPVHTERNSATLAWIEGRMSNFDYLMCLNEWAGRRSGDPNFHPVMPWVIDFTSPTSWRDLTKTKFRLNKGDEQLDFTYANPIPVSMSQGGKESGASARFSSHRSDAASPYHINDTLTELTYYNYFARRTPLCVLKKYVRTNFVAAEYPSSMERLYTWSPDECIPEFYADPSIFCSLNPELPDLAVPVWAGNDVQRFLQLHREALESEQVSRFLHQWIDLTFGHKLSGEAGKQAKNVALMDRTAHRNHGFVQLFLIPHPPRRRVSALSSLAHKSIQWTTRDPTTGELVPSMPTVITQQGVQIGSASGITSSFPSQSDATSAKDRRKSVARPGGPSSASTGPVTPANIFSGLPKIVINRNTLPTPVLGSVAAEKIFSEKTAAGAQSFSATQTNPQQTNTSVPSNSSQPTSSSLTSGSDAEDTPNGKVPARLQRQASADASLLQSTPPTKESSVPPLHRSVSDFGAQERNSPSAERQSSSPKENPTSTASSAHSTGAVPTTESSECATTEISNSGAQASPSHPSGALVASAIPSKLMESDSSAHYASDSSDGGSEPNDLFRLSTDSLAPPTPMNSSPMATSPLADDLETYQSASIATMTSPLNFSISDSGSKSPKSVPLSHSSGITYPVEPTSKPTRSALSNPPAGSAGSNSSSPSTTSTMQTSNSRSSSSPKERSDKEKEKTSLRKEFMKIIGSLSDAVLPDKKNSQALSAGPSSSSTPPSSSTQHHSGANTGFTASPGTTGNQNSNFSASHSPASASTTNASKWSSSRSGSSQYEPGAMPLGPGIPSGSNFVVSSYSEASLTGDNSIIDDDNTISAQSSSRGLSHSMSEVETGSSSSPSPFSGQNQVSTGASRSVNKQSNTSIFVEDMTTGEYQSRFMMQVSLLEPIFIAPFAHFEFDMDSQDETYKNHIEKVIADRAKCADLFSAGCIIYQLFSGTPLFHRDNILQYLQGDGTWWWGTASQSIPRRYKALIFDLVLAGRPYFIYALQSGIELEYVSKGIICSQSEHDNDAGGSISENAFDFGVATVLSPNASSSPSHNVTPSNLTVSTIISQRPANAVSHKIGIFDLENFSDGLLDRFLNDDLISSPTSMKVFPSHFELVYQFLARYHGTKSWKKRVRLALDNISFLVNLPISGLELILPDLLSFFDRQETVVDALALIEPLAIKMGRTMTIDKLLGPLLRLYERMQQLSAGTISVGSSSGVENRSEIQLDLALELLAPRFVHTLLSKFGQQTFLKHIIGFLVNEVRSSKREIGFASGSALLRLVSVLSPPIYLRYVLYPLLGQLNKANTDVLLSVLVEIGARMGEDVIVRHHMETIIPLLQTHIFNKEDAIAIRTSIALLKLISSLCSLIHPSKILNTMMVDHRCLFAILLNPPTHRDVWDALLDCLSSITSSIGLHLAIRYARPYVQQFFSIFGPSPSSPEQERAIISRVTGNSNFSKNEIVAPGLETASTHSALNDLKSQYPSMVLAKFKDLLEIRSGGGNVSIQQALGPALRIESYLMGPVVDQTPKNPLDDDSVGTGAKEQKEPIISVSSASTAPSGTNSNVSNNSSSNNTQTSSGEPKTTSSESENAAANVTVSDLSDSASAQANPPVERVSPQPSFSLATGGLQIPSSETSTSTLNSGQSENASSSSQSQSSGSNPQNTASNTSNQPASTTLAPRPRRLSGAARPVSPTLSNLASPPPPTQQRLSTANEDGHIADTMPNWLSSMLGAAYVPVAQTLAAANQARLSSSLSAVGGAQGAQGSGQNSGTSSSNSASTSSVANPHSSLAASASAAGEKNSGKKSSNLMTSSHASGASSGTGSNHSSFSGSHHSGIQGHPSNSSESHGYGTTSFIPGNPNSRHSISQPLLSTGAPWLDANQRDHEEMNSFGTNSGGSATGMGQQGGANQLNLPLHSFGPAQPVATTSSWLASTANIQGTTPSSFTGWPPALSPHQTWNFGAQIGHVFKEHSSNIRCISVHDNERLFLSGSKDTTVKCWDLLSEGSSRQTYTGHKASVSHAEFVDRGNLVASCDGTLHVWELERGTRLANLEAATVSPYASSTAAGKEFSGSTLNFSSSSSPSPFFTCFTSHQDGRVIVGGTSVSTVTFTDLRADADVVCEWFLPSTTFSSPSGSSSSSSGSSLSSSSSTGSSNSPAPYPRSISLGLMDQNMMLVGQMSGHITVIDVRSGLLLHHWRAHDAPITSLKPVPDSPGFMVSSSLDKTLALWDVSNASSASPQCLTYFKGHSDPNISFDVFRGSLYSVSGQKFSIAPLFNQPSSVLIEKRKLLKTSSLKLTNQLTSFAILQSQHMALLGSDDGTIKVLQ